jgi:Cd2+/Zn2+-exporting ATPase
VFQTLAVKRAKANIKTLLDQRPDTVTVLQNNEAKTVRAEAVNIDDIIQLKAGEKLGLDGELLSDSASFNTAALTGESKPDTKSKGEIVLAGMINLNTVSQIKVTTAYKDSKLSKILELVQNATAQKASPVKNAAKITYTSTGCADEAMDRTISALNMVSPANVITAGGVNATHQW